MCVDIVTLLSSYIAGLRTDDAGWMPLSPSHQPVATTSRAIRTEIVRPSWRWVEDD